MTILRVALVGDYSSEVLAHRAIPGALERAAALLGQTVAPTWIASPAWDHDAVGQAGAFDGLWCVPGSPYASMDGALAAIRAAREGRGVFPFEAPSSRRSSRWKKQFEPKRSSHHQ